ncbi:hypothetical protein COCNU_10G009420 [Cocos nucifera]|uniref:Uncharacterized protein n=1 Tax=Cocos nucifera TaxID=13894 RepID=A0A8K0N8L3_COCNU|nr:hypothetical protein COCNU_10G009420 [Cocos nucifera]
MGDFNAAGHARERKDQRGRRGRRSAAMLDVRKEEDRPQHKVRKKKEIGHGTWHAEGRKSAAGGRPNMPKFRLGAGKPKGHRKGGDRMVPAGLEEARGVPTGSEELILATVPVSKHDKPPSIVTDKNIKLLFEMQKKRSFWEETYLGLEED